MRSHYITEFMYNCQEPLGSVTLLSFFYGELGFKFPFTICCKEKKNNNKKFTNKAPTKVSFVRWV